MATIYDVNPNALIEEVAAQLKEQKKITPPEWSLFVKTGVHKQRVPSQDNWWYLRAASVLRKISLLGPIGTSKLRRFYGGRKNNGAKPEHFEKGSGKIVRTVLQQLEEAKLVAQPPKTSTRKGRIITGAGQSLMDKAASKIIKQ